MSDMTVMPLEKIIKILKIEKYFDVVILFNGFQYEIIKNLSKKKNKIMMITEYIFNQDQLVVQK